MTSVEPENKEPQETKEQDVCVIEQVETGDGIEIEIPSGKCLCYSKCKASENYQFWLKTFIISFIVLACILLGIFVSLLLANSDEIQCKVNCDITCSVNIGNIDYSIRSADITNGTILYGKYYILNVTNITSGYENVTVQANRTEFLNDTNGTTGHNKTNNKVIVKDTKIEFGNDTDEIDPFMEIIMPNETNVSAGILNTNLKYCDVPDPYFMCVKNVTHDIVAVTVENSTFTNATYINGTSINGILINSTYIMDGIFVINGESKKGIYNVSCAIDVNLAAKRISDLFEVNLEGDDSMIDHVDWAGMVYFDQYLELVNSVTPLEREGWNLDDLDRYISGNLSVWSLLRSLFEDDDDDVAKKTEGNHRKKLLARYGK